jgi:hypothetical protein
VIEKIICNFSSKIDESNLIPNFDEPFWNFYEWSDGSANDEELVVGCERHYKHDLILNCAFLYALSFYKKMLNHLGEKIDIDTKKIKESIVSKFYDKEKELFFLSDYGERKYSQLGNSFAILIGLGDEKLSKKIINDNLVEATLSMRGFVYDALLSLGDINKEYVLNDIRSKYGYMLSKGATSFWETMNGVNENHRASSLCHGWSAMPIYYYHKIFNN